MDVEWYYSTGAQDRTGPVSWADIEAAHRAGVIGPSSLVWASHLAGWVPAGTLLDPLPGAPPPGPGSAPPPAPGARASFHCGFWALVTTLLCFPVGVVLGIVAIVKNQQAQRKVRENPGAYAKPGSAGLVMGILALAILPGLVAVGIAAAIAIPAFQSQRGRARDHGAIGNLNTGLYDLVGRYDQLRDRSPMEVKAGLEAGLREQAARNPWSLQDPPCSYTIQVVSGRDEEGFKAAARSTAGPMGECVYTVQFPVERQPGMVGGAVRIQYPVAGSTLYVKVIPLD